MFPFEQWKGYLYPEDGMSGLEQYTEENCTKAQDIFDVLIDGLIVLGETGSKSKKEKLFEIAITDLNTLNDEVGGGLIETDERECLCNLIDEICLAAGLDTGEYANGARMSDMWRDW